MKTDDNMNSHIPASIPDKTPRNRGFENGLACYSYLRVSCNKIDKVRFFEAIYKLRKCGLKVFKIVDKK